MLHDMLTADGVEILISFSFIYGCGLIFPSQTVIFEKNKFKITKSHLIFIGIYSVLFLAIKYFQPVKTVLSHIDSKYLLISNTSSFEILIPGIFLILFSLIIAFIKLLLNKALLPDKRKKEKENTDVLTSQIHIPISNNHIDPSILTVIGAKGGGGKTVIASSMAYLLSKIGFKILLIDLDFATHGITFFLPAHLDKLQNTDSTTAEYFIGGKQNMPIELSTDIKNIYLMPSTRLNLELGMNNNINLNNFETNFKNLIAHISHSHKYDYIIVDTMGGNDQSSTCSAINSTAYLLVTEPDLPSIDMCKSILNPIGRAANQNLSGLFIINKSVFHLEDLQNTINVFQNRFNCRHVSTIPLDNNVISHFQVKEIPVMKDIGCKFSHEIINIIKRIYFKYSWSDEQKKRIDNIIKKSEQAYNKKIRVEDNNKQLKNIIMIYGAFLSFFILIRMYFKNVFRDDVVTIVVVFSILTLFVIISSETLLNIFCMIIKIISNIFTHKKDNNTSFDQNI